ncbi:2OG-Fe(II) oxygenase [Ruegeria sp. 2205SS24-7]|uniref:2OG-Fe(II) oxygenase n=1 Tax=Ruegeria discodermiae TaxID=3064389 RepID=UPI0027410E39|nr:2OG-Fe(II) oxygenase [Ruegeria sp. 2205SS24-7]MDP5220102.1 2OG-Fe(II) oxygenase [Ruegeria sp. 2205SS24-7]
MTQTSLQRAHTIKRPSREEMLQRAPSVQYFWDENKTLFADAWSEWEASLGSDLPKLDNSIFDPRLRDAIETAWTDPNKEGAVKDLWEEVFPGVYRTQFFNLDQLATLRAYMDAVSEADIPLRPPYGIVLNRGGAMLDPRSKGYLAAPTFQSFYQELMNRYMRPVSRLLFPDVHGYDTQTFGFSIQWQANKDTSLRPHSDASAVTLNINLNLPGEDYSGSAVSFIDPDSRRVEKLTFEPGTALIHHGSVPHASEPITSGERFNFVLWLYGDRGQIPMEGAPAPDIKPAHRWSLPENKSDGFAPF